MIVFNNGATATRLYQLGDGCEQVEKQVNDIFHATESRKLLPIAAMLNQLILSINYEFAMHKCVRRMEESDSLISRGWIPMESTI